MSGLKIINYLYPQIVHGLKAPGGQSKSKQVHLHNDDQDWAHLRRVGGGISGSSLLADGGDSSSKMHPADIAEPACGSPGCCKIKFNSHLRLYRFKNVIQK
jgi:hypothetical protein